MVLCTCWIYSVVYILHCVHDGHATFYSYGSLCVLDIRCRVEMMLCTCFI